MIEKYEAKQIKKKFDKLKLKVTPQIKVDEIIECEGSFFYINKQALTGYGKTEYTRYFLRTVVKKEDIDRMKEILRLDQTEAVEVQKR